MSDNKIEMTPARYARKTAYHIDPLLAASVTVKDQLNPRCEEERFADELWKQRVSNDKGRLFWKPMLSLLVLVLAIGIPTTHSQSVFANKPGPTVEINDRGDDVIKVQYVLRSYGYSVEVDGIYGPQTQKAVTHFQKVSGLFVDGVAGPQTLGAMKITLGVVTPSPAPVVVSQPAQTPSTPTYNGGAAGADQWHDLAMAVGWTEAQWPVLRCIISRESRGIASAKNPNSSATGLLQIIASYHRGHDLYNPEVNLQVGLEMYNDVGWKPWYYKPKPCY